MVRHRDDERGGAGRLAPVIPIREGLWTAPGAADESAPSTGGPAARHGRTGRAGRDADDEGTRDAGDPAVFAAIEESSLRALGRRSLSRRELERALRRLGYADHDVDAELDRLEGVGLIDDTALAQRLAEQLQERKGLVGSAIKAELARRVLHPSAIDAAMALVDTGDEVATASELASVRARQYGQLDPATIERRLTAWLMRRGFSSSAVRTAVRAAIEELRSA